MSSDRSRNNSAKERIAMVDPTAFSAAQRAVYDKIVAGKRGKVVGPLRVALHSPELADRWQSLGEFLRFQANLPTLLTELAIITTGRFWNSQVEWMIHARIAADSGLSPSVIEAIRQAEPPQFDDPLEARIYDFTRELLEFGQVGDALYDDLHSRLGDVSLVELTAVIGYYSMVAMTLNVHQVPVPESEHARPLDLPAETSRLRPTPLPPAQVSGSEERMNNG